MPVIMWGISYSCKYLTGMGLKAVMVKANLQGAYGSGAHHFYFDALVAQSTMQLFLPGELSPVMLGTYLLVRALQRVHGVRGALAVVPACDSRTHAAVLEQGSVARSAVQGRVGFTVASLIAPIQTAVTLTVITRYQNQEHYFLYRCVTEDDMVNVRFAMAIFVIWELVLFVAETIAYLRAGNAAIIFRTMIDVLIGDYERVLDHVVVMGGMGLLFNSCFFISFDGLYLITFLEDAAKCVAVAKDWA